MVRSARQNALELATSDLASGSGESTASTMLSPAIGNDNPLHEDDRKQEGHAEQEAGHAKRRLKVDPRHKRLPLCRSDFDPAHSALQLRWLRNANRQHAVAKLCVNLLLAGLKG